MTDSNIMPTHSLFQDLTGQRFARFIVIDFSHTNDIGKYWNCECDCGARKTIRGAHLKSGNTLSCGCLHREIKTNHIKHGHNRRTNKTPEYMTWAGMVSRCTQSSVPAFRLYGGRGIKVCERWRNDFQSFLKDMGYRPSANHSLDRIDSNGDYEKKNCRWATRKEQNRNTSRNRYLTYQGKTLTFGEWSESTRIKYSTLYGRWKNGLLIEDILSPKVGRWKA